MNRLAREKSPYLLQHQHNPVEWFPWGEEAFEKARREGKPIFLSIGYSTCHWCHVMERESFESEAMAALLNRWFVAIKVDREERPDVDRVYMAYVQATTGSGGWPMSVFLTPELKPFFGGTYFPPEDRYGRPGFATVLRRLAELWAEERAKIEAHGEEALASLRETTLPAGEKAPLVANDAAAQAVLQAGLEQVRRSYEPEEGGFSLAPKFPRPVTLDFLMRYQAMAAFGEADRRNAQEMTLFTLRKMAAGGIRDHLGGGFHRYSVDRLWHIPHYEKMLYDQGQLICAYLEAYQLTRDPLYADVALETLEYVMRDLGTPEGAFYSAEDADSPLPDHPEEKREGAFYVWTEAEIDAALAPDDAAVFKSVYGVEPGGNAPEGSDPHGELAGTNTLIQRGSGDPETLARCRRILLERRAQRPRPHLDDKVITAWNGLTLSALARAAQCFGDRRWLDAATRTAAFLQAHLVREGRLLRSWRGEPGAAFAFAEDYAFLIAGLIDLYEAGGGIVWLQWAVALQEQLDTLFYDEAQGGYWATAGDDPSILLRLKDDYDGAEPSANSVAALNALRLAAMLDNTTLRRRGERTIEAFAMPLARMPMALPKMLSSLAAAMAKPRALVIAGDPQEAAPLLAEIHRRFIPNKTILFADGGTAQAWLAERLPFLAGVRAVGGKATVYLCENNTCQAPVTTPEALAALL